MKTHRLYAALICLLFLLGVSGCTPADADPSSPSQPASPSASTPAPAAHEGPYQEDAVTAIASSNMTYYAIDRSWTPWRMGGDTVSRLPGAYYGEAPAEFVPILKGVSSVAQYEPVLQKDRLREIRQTQVLEGVLDASR